MSIDCVAEISINRTRTDVATFAVNAGNDPVWIGGITEAKVLTSQPFGKGTQVERIATFLGKRIEYVNEVVQYEPDARLVMKSIKSPVPMVVTYEFEETRGGTVARIRVKGEANGFYKLAKPLLARAVKRSITNDLATLKDLLEADIDQERHRSSAAGHRPPGATQNE